MKAKYSITPAKISNQKLMLVCKCGHTNFTFISDGQEVDQINLSDTTKRIIQNSKCKGCQEVMQYQFTVDKWDNLFI
jgi:hypothetical protein